MTEMEKEILSRLETLWKEARDEVKQRIKQRDSFFIRMYISFAAILVATVKNELALVFLPFVALYFSVLVSHSYQIHSALASYMKDNLEVNIKKILYPGSPKKAQLEHLEYEEMFKQKNLVSVRSWLYEGVTYFISAITIGLAWLLCVSLQNLTLIAISSFICSVGWFIFKTVKLKSHQ